MVHSDWNGSSALRISSFTAAHGIAWVSKQSLASSGSLATNRSNFEWADNDRKYRPDCIKTT